MAPELGETLAALCSDHGWSYGVVWRVGREDSRVMTVVGSYCEEHAASMVGNMLNQVHVVGEGIIGRAITNDKHEWIFQDAYRTDMSTDNTEWLRQFLAGIETILIASLPSVGAVQFGSINKIPESMEFVDKAKRMLQLNVHAYGYFPVHHGALTSTNFSGDAYISCSNSNSLNDTDKITVSQDSLTKIAQYASTFTQESCYDIGFCSSTINAYAIPGPITSKYADVSTDFCRQFHETPSAGTAPTHCLINQTNGTNAQGEDQISSISRLFAGSSCLDSSVAACFDENSWTSSIGVPLMGQEFLTDLVLQELPNLVPVNSYYPIPHDNSSGLVTDGSLSSNLCGLEDSMLDSRSSNTSKGFFSGAEKLSLPSGNLLNAAAFCYVPSSASDPITTFANPQCLTSASSSLVHSNDDVTNNPTQLCNHASKTVASNMNVQINKDPLGSISASSGYLARNNNQFDMEAEVIRSRFDKPSSMGRAPGLCSHNIEGSSTPCLQLLSDNDLFDGMELDICPNNFVQENWDDIMIPSSLKVSESVSDLQIGSAATVNKGSFSQSSLEQLLDAIIGENAKNSAHASLTKSVHPNDDPHLEHQLSTVTSLGIPQVYKNQPSTINFTPNILASISKPENLCGSQKGALLKAGVSSWIDDSCSKNTGNSLISHHKKAEEAVKVVKKRARPGESTRPRPKDRQQIQDRVKELREIVPNGAKCSIDALLDRTIKHMLFLQSVTKYANKLKQADEPKMIVEDSGVVLKDNSGSSGTGGATWAYEVAGQTMVCPIIVEDLTPPGQMLVEMLCEERGFFLEIADIIRGFGLTILKGVMEKRECKIWARFLVEANKEVTRMDIFLSLVQLLQQTTSIRSNEQMNKVMEKRTSIFPNCQQTSMPIPVSLSDSAVI